MPAAEVIEPSAIRLWAQRLAAELSASANLKKLLAILIYIVWWYKLEKASLALVEAKIWRVICHACNIKQNAVFFY